MRRTQIQLPDPLYRELKRIAEDRGWSLAEVMRRAGESFAARYSEQQLNLRQLPDSLDLGGNFLRPPESYRAEVEAILSKVPS